MDINIRNIDGDPHEVAAQAIELSVGMVNDLIEFIEEAEWAARNAWLSAEDHAGHEMQPERWPQTPQGRYWEAVKGRLRYTSQVLPLLAKAASFDPLSEAS